MKESSETTAGSPTEDPVSRRDYGPRAAAAPFQLSQEPFTPQGPSKPRPPGAVPAPAFEHLGELPATYGTHSLYLVAYDPRQLFAYWDIDWSEARGKQFVLQVKRADGAVESRITLSAGETCRYIAVAQAGARYALELTSRGRDGQWRALASSGPVTMPPEGISTEEEPTFATLPFHLSFQRLIELLRGAIRPSEDLTGVLSRLQQGGQAGASTSLLGALGSLGPEQLQTLEALVRDGNEGLKKSLWGSQGAAGSNSGGMGSETLSSPGLGSEVRLAAAAAGAETLSSGQTSRGRWLEAGLSSETLSSRGRPFGPLLAAGGMGSESLASGELGRRALSAAGGISSESLTSRGLSSSAHAAAAARGSEIMGSVARPGSFGLSSEAWRKAAMAAAAGGSETLAGNSSAAFLRAVESNLTVLGSLFSDAVHSQLSGGGGSSSLSSPSSRGRW